MARKIVIKHIDTGKIEKEFDVTDKSQSYIDKLENGLYNRVDLDRFTIETIND